MQVTKSGPVRVDLVGGTLDLTPIDLLLNKSVTINLATSLKAEVKIKKRDDHKVIIHSQDYDKKYEFRTSDFTSENFSKNQFFKEMTFLCRLIELAQMNCGLDIELSSNAPPGSGLGGSSSMGVIFYSALNELNGKALPKESIIAHVRAVEGMILNRGVPGYQDYYPALYGGILALKGGPKGIKVEQLYCEELKTFLENHITLVFSGITRNSGINNWDVYKKFFDKDSLVQKGLTDIAEISFKLLECIKNREYNKILNLIHSEGEKRKLLASGIVPYEVEAFISLLKKEIPAVGYKMCGAGGGGCFILVHKPEEKSYISKQIGASSMRELEFSISLPFEKAQA